MKKEIRCILIAISAIFLSSCDQELNNPVNNEGSATPPSLSKTVTIPSVNESVGHSNSSTYNDNIDRSSPKTISNIKALVISLENATDGDIFVITEDLTITPSDLAKIPSLPIDINANNIIITKDAGCSGYRLIESQVDLVGSELFNISNKTNVRFSGLYIKGNENKNILSSGIKAWNSDGLEVDNCKIEGWSNSGIWFSGTNSSWAHIHHCEFRNNQYKDGRQGYGYGFSLGRNSKVVFESNLCENNRHDITGGGDPGQEFYICFNTFLAGTSNPNIDVHGYGEVNGEPMVDQEAASIIHIYNNEFHYEDASNAEAIDIRGIPTNYCKIEYNDFNNYPDEDIAIQQRRFFGKFAADPLINDFASDNPGFYISWNGTSEWYKIATKTIDNFSDVIVGDFDGNNTLVDGQPLSYSDDLFFIDENMYRPFVIGAGKLDGDSFPLSFNDLTSIFADFNNDSKEDVIQLTGNQIIVDINGVTSTVQSSITKDLVHLGDFDGDGYLDLFRVNGNSEWKILFGENTATGYDWTGWETVRTMNTTDYGYGKNINEIKFGNFNADSCLDVIIKTIIGGSGYYKYCSLDLTNNEFGDWKHLIKTNVSFDDIFIGNFDGDNTSDDIFRANGTKWYISKNSITGWIELNSSSQFTEGLRFGDFNGDGVTDVLVYQ